MNLCLGCEKRKTIPGRPVCSSCSLDRNDLVLYSLIRDGRVIRLVPRQRDPVVALILERRRGDGEVYLKPRREK